MTRTAGVVALLTLPAAARADMAPPPHLRAVPLVVILTTDQDHPDFEFFLVNWAGGKPERLALSAASPVVLLPDGRTGAYREWTLHAVPKRLLPPDGPMPAGADWFGRHREPGTASFGTFDFGYNTAGFYDDRERIEVTYRVEHGPDGWRLVKVGENAGSRWVKCVRLAPVVLLPVGLFAVLRWWSRRRFRRGGSRVFPNS